MLTRVQVAAGRHNRVYPAGAQPFLKFCVCAKLCYGIYE